MAHQKRDINGTSRKTYHRPLVREVRLRPEEAVLGNCKVSGSTGPLQSNCNSPVACSSLAS